MGAAGPSMRVKRRAGPAPPAGRTASPVLFHLLALVESGAVGEGTRVWAFAHVMEGAKVGAGCNVGEGCYVESGSVLGDRVTLKNGVSVWDGVTLEDDVFAGPNVVFTNDLRPRSRKYHGSPSTTLVRRGASLGANATILSGIEVGEHAMVGAGAVVTKSVPAYGLAYGVPARVVGYVCACAAPLVFRSGRARCACGARYENKTGQVRPVGTPEPRGRVR